MPDGTTTTDRLEQVAREDWREALEFAVQMAREYRCDCRSRGIRCETCECLEFEVQPGEDALWTYSRLAFAAADEVRNVLFPIADMIARAHEVLAARAAGKPRLDRLAPEAEPLIAVLSTLALDVARAAAVLGEIGDLCEPLEGEDPRALYRAAREAESRKRIECCQQDGAE